jgi:hypothetical protein
METGQGLSAIREVVQIVAYIVTTAGALFGLYKYLGEKKRERQNREKQAFETTNKRYADFLGLCLNTDPRMFDLAPRLLANKPELKSEDQKSAYLRETIVLTAATAMIETAYVWYQYDKRTADLEDQWQAWQRYIDFWLDRPDFKEAWPQIADLFHNKFVTYMNARLETRPARLLATSDARTPVK